MKLQSQHKEVPFFSHDSYIWCNYSTIAKQQFYFLWKFPRKISEPLFPTHLHAHTCSCTYFCVCTEEPFYLRLSAWRHPQSIAACYPEGGWKASNSDTIPFGIRSSPGGWRQRIIWGHAQDSCIKAFTINYQTQQPDRLKEQFYDV